MPAAARKGDTDTGHGAFPATPITSASPDVEIDGIPAALAGRYTRRTCQPKRPTTRTRHIRWVSNDLH